MIIQLGKIVVVVRMIVTDCKEVFVAIMFQLPRRICGAWFLSSFCLCCIGFSSGVGGLGGFKPLPLRKVCIFYYFNEQKQWLVIKIVATRCHILRLKCTKFRLRWPRWGAHIIIIIIIII